MDWINLSEAKDPAFGRGQVFRTSAVYPYEDLVDFMLINDPDSPSSFTLIVATGAKAGHVLIKLPSESLTPNENGRGICAKWLKKNWNKWVYKSDVSQVRMVRWYPAPEF